MQSFFIIELVGQYCGLAAGHLDLGWRLVTDLGVHNYMKKNKSFLCFKTVNTVFRGFVYYPLLVSLSAVASCSLLWKI